MSTYHAQCGCTKAGALIPNVAVRHGARNGLVYGLFLDTVNHHTGGSGPSFGFLKHSATSEPGGPSIKGAICRGVIPCIYAQRLETAHQIMRAHVCTNPIALPKVQGSE
jgi:hypothetical protein